MKKVAFLVMFFLTSYTSYSQQFISSPKAKNAQIVKFKTPKLNLMHDSAPSSLHGPFSKNRAIWMEEPGRKLKIGFRNEINNPKGLRAKNANPWDKKSHVNFNSKAAYIEPKSMRAKKSWIH